MGLCTAGATLSFSIHAASLISEPVDTRTAHIILNCNDTTPEIAPHIGYVLQVVIIFDTFSNGWIRRNVRQGTRKELLVN